MKKYRRLRIREEDYKNLQIKQQKMCSTLKVITGKTIRIPMTKVLNIVSTEPLYIRDKDLIKLGSKKR